MKFEPVIGLEVHVEMETRSKMFCACPVVDLTTAQPNSAVCPVCAGMPGALPVINQMAVEFALRVALSLDCEINQTSIFARKNYFYPDLPKGYQISQYEEPLAVNGKITINTSQGPKIIRIHRVHLEEDTGKLTHVDNKNGDYSLVDLNRSGVALLEIVTEADFRSAEEVRAYAEMLRTLVRHLGVNSGDLEKGVMRIEPNISVRPIGQEKFGTKVEIKNLNSFRALERGVAYEINRHVELINAGGTVAQETVGWDENTQATYSQRSKEDAHDYRYFPEPDLPPLIIEQNWIEAVKQALPELPWNKIARFMKSYDLTLVEATKLVEEQAVSEYFEQVTAASSVAARTVFAWFTGELFALMNDSGQTIHQIKINPQDLADLIKLVADGEINQSTGKTVLAEMFKTGQSAKSIVEEKGLKQVSDGDFIAKIITETLAENADEVTSYKAGKLTVANFLFGQVMKKAGGRANPQVVRTELEKQLNN